MALSGQQLYFLLMGRTALSKLNWDEINSERAALQARHRRADRRASSHDGRDTQGCPGRQQRHLALRVKREIGGRPLLKERYVPTPLAGSCRFNQASSCSRVIPRTPIREMSK
jgi:hypothetical protein